MHREWYIQVTYVNTSMFICRDLSPPTVMQIQVLNSNFILIQGHTSLYNGYTTLYNGHTMDIQVYIMDIYNGDTNLYNGHTSTMDIQEYTSLYNRHTGTYRCIPSIGH